MSASTKKSTTPKLHSIDIKEAGGFGTCFHTALRKLCDSKVTSLMYNIVWLCKSPVWASMCEMMEEEFQGKKFREREDFAKAAKHFWTHDDLYSKLQTKLDKEYKKMEASEFYSLQIAGELMELEDWVMALDYMWPDNV